MRVIQCKNEISPDETSKKLHCIVDFNPFNPNLKEMVLKHWPVLEHSSSTRLLLEDKLIFGFRRPKSLMDLLCRSDVGQKILNNRNRMPYCPRMGKCTHCPRLNKTGRIMSYSTGRKYQTPKKVTCRSSNLHRL